MNDSHLHIALAFDSLAFRGACLTIQSAMSTLAPDAKATFHLFVKQLPGPAVEFLGQVMRRHGPRFDAVYYPIDDSSYTGCATLHGSLMVYVRIEMPQMAPTSRLLYLDCDTLVTDDLMSLWTIDMQGASLGAVTLATVRWSNDSEFLSSNGVEVDAAYFNSGVLLVDCEMWRNQSITSTLRSLLAAHGPSLRVVDQTLLNLHFHSSFFHLPPKWNRHIYANQALPELGPGILHFLGQPKPWNFVGGQFHPARKTYKHIVKKQQMSIPALSWAEFTRSPRVIVKSLRSIYRAACANFKHRSP